MLEHIKANIKKSQFRLTKKVIVFNFHQSTDLFNPQVHGRFTWSEIGLLEKNIRFLAENFLVVPLHEALKEMRTGYLRNTKVAITVDDGDISLRTHIVPLLTRYQIPATFFVNTAYITGEKKGYWFNIFNYLKNGTETQKQWANEDLEKVFTELRNTTDQDYYRANHKRIELLEEHTGDDFRPYVDMEYLSGLDQGLFSLGLHGHEHQRFSMMPHEWKKRDMQRNLEILSGMKGFIRVFAVPFGKSIDWDADTYEICRELGLQIALSDNGYNTHYIHGIRRIPADGKDLKLILENLSLTPRKLIS